MTSAPRPTTTSPDVAFIEGIGVVHLAGRTRGHFVSPYDGRYGALEPAAVRDLVRRLIADVDLTSIEVVVGLPEGGNVPAFAFGEEAGLPVVLATALQPELPAMIEFVEEHAVNHDHVKYIHGLRAGQRVIIVEDEVSSGQTVINCVRAMRAAGVRCEQVATFLAVDDQGMRERLAAEGIELRAVLLIPAADARALHRDA